MATTDVQQDQHEGDGAGNARTVAGVPARTRLALPRWPAAWQTLWRFLSAPFGELPEAPAGGRGRAGLAAVSVMAVAFVGFFTSYLWSLQDAYQTHAEDLGIMDQALWNTVHGAVLHQTICNIVTDTNCLGDISRLGIHFEPIMFPIALLYLVVPSPKTLQLLQALVVATGAFPAYWIASRRLRSALAGVAFAAIYLLYPALDAAVTYDFHAVTLSAAFLMFALYFMLSRNDVGLVVTSLLALSTKEEIVVDIAMIGLCILVFQRRWRIGSGLVALAVIWLVIELAIMHAMSPLGHSPTAGRYAYLGHSPAQAALYVLTHPLQVLRQHVFDAEGIYYLRTLLSPAAYLPVLSPSVLLIAVPALGINLLSSDPTMHSGIFQYNAEIVPVLVFASIESVVLLSTGMRWLGAHAEPALGRLAGVVTWRSWGQPATLARAAAAGLILLVLVFGLHEQQQHGYLPITKGFSWPQSTPHTRLADTLLPLIPANASVSAQSDLVPHVSHRRFIYLYPYHGTDADYVFLDVTGNLYPYTTQPWVYDEGVASLLQSHTYHVIAARDGYLLLARGAGPTLNPANPFGLPDSFFTFAHPAPGQAITHPTAIHFGPSLELVGYDITPAGRVTVNTSVTVTTYWRVLAPLSGTAYPQLVQTRQDGSQFVVSDFAAIEWLPMSRWQPGQTYAVTSWPQFLGGRDMGRLRMGVRVVGSAGGGTGPLPASVDAAAAGESPPISAGTQAILFDQVLTP
jgi:uncharacterized membrane protein